MVVTLAAFVFGCCYKMSVYFLGTCLHCFDLKVGLFDVTVILLAGITLGFVPCKNLIVLELCILSESFTPISFAQLGVALMWLHCFQRL